MFTFAAKSACGASHVRNDDRIFVAGQVLTGAEEPTTEAAHSGTAAGTRFVACTFDGVGGSVRGDIAALAGALSLAKNLAATPDLPLDELVTACAADVAAGQEELAHEERAYTVGAGMLIEKADGCAKATPFHMGDCRVYRYRAPYLTALTKDHSLANRYRDEMGPDVVVPANIAHVVTRYAGGEIENPIEVGRTYPCFAGDLFLAASDGLWEHIDEALMEGFLSLVNPSEPASLENALAHIVKAAQENGSPDDVSGVLFAWTKDED